MVFIGGWRSRRRGYGPYGGYGPPPGYGRRYRGGNSCARDMCLVESGCCLADLIGCGPQVALVGPSLLHRSAHDASIQASTQASDAAGSTGAREWLLRFMIAAIGVYQSEISPKRRACCRYEPTCSHYALQALQIHGLRRGGWLAVRRLLRCRPGSAGGPDPVPQLS